MNDIRDQVKTDDAAEAEFLSRIQQQLDQSCDRLDARTVSRLNSIRHAALEHKQKKVNPLWLSFGGMVTATFLVFSLNLTSLQLPGSAGLPADEAATLEDIEILTTTEELDFYEEYEFYQWLAENDSSV
jgi:hypothetical protein